MRNNFGAKAILYPMPVLIIGKYDENGKPNAMNAAWTEDKTEDKFDEEQKPEKPFAADPTMTGVSDLLETERHIQYMNGYDNGTFKPENNMTRAEAAQIFYNLLLNKNISGESVFDDVDRDAWYYDAVSTLANMGIIKGKGSNTFDPEGEITRAEFTAIVMRFVNVDVNGSEAFDDVPQSHWAVKNISDAAALGWISGNGDGSFSPTLQLLVLLLLRLSTICLEERRILNI